MNTTDENTELFIETVRGYAILYDLKNKDYKNIRKKDKIWDLIGSEFQMDGDAAKKKWKNLRDTYAKYAKSTKTTTGQAAKKNYGNWQWAEQMKFLKTHLIFAKTIHNIDSLSDNESINQMNSQIVAVDNTCNDSISHDGIIVEHNSPISNIPSAGRHSFESGSNTQKNKNKKDTPVNQVLQYFEKKSLKRSEAQMDELEHIFMGYAKSVKKLSRRRQTIIKMKLAEIIAEQELAEIDENTSVNSPYSSSSIPNFSDYGNYLNSNPEKTPVATTLSFSNFAPYSNTPSTSSANILQPIINNNNNLETTIALDTVTSITDSASPTATYFSNFSL